ncbi:hypothetical protein CDV36_001523 [Fusarium kuroshium]|uniref:Uncharacterized protein n=1 Tax=Fusarium kuroshium TaxID=2010991 RepID=A0A3M2SMK7_9HYPO|nr:hypothetical protein CDV36_001523 [Fusarium kuroshium]
MGPLLRAKVTHRQASYHWTPCADAENPPRRPPACKKPLKLVPLFTAYGSSSAEKRPDNQPTNPCSSVPPRSQSQNP